jgi:hypothetical protein
MEILIPLLAIFSLFLVPIGGLMLILTTRFAFKPLVETLSKALRESGHGRAGLEPWQIQELTDQVESLREEVRQLREAQDFDRKLLAEKNHTTGVPE